MYTHAAVAVGITSLICLPLQSMGEQQVSSSRSPGRFCHFDEGEAMDLIANHSQSEGVFFKGGVTTQLIYKSSI